MADGTEPPAESDLERRAAGLVRLFVTALDAIAARDKEGRDTTALRRWAVELQADLADLKAQRDPVWTPPPSGRNDRHT
jgi:hypothetical protein